MNDRQLYQALTALTTSNPEFFHRDETGLGGTQYRIFSYELAAWSSFLLPGALEARGIMFDITNPDEPVVVSRSPKKFFNFSEGGVKHDQGRAVLVMEKLDGSMINTYLTSGGFIGLKTKNSISSPEALQAAFWLRNQPELMNQLMSYEKSGYTITMEWTSPGNQIVVPYTQDQLRVLCVRHRHTGETHYPGDPVLAGLNQWLVETISPDETTPSRLNSLAEDLTEGEGWVLVIQGPSGPYPVKCKSRRYVNLHRTRGSNPSVRAIYQSVISGGGDDLRSIHRENPATMVLIDRVESWVIPRAGQSLAQVTEHMARYRTMERREFAIESQRVLDSGMFKWAMSIYLGREDGGLEKYMEGIYEVMCRETGLS